MSVIKNGKQLFFQDVTSTSPKLTKGVYMLLYNESKDLFYLEEKDPFKLPKKLYGDFSDIDRWIKSYKHNTQKNLGILLSGLKGGGKTIEAQKFCIDINLPVIIIPSTYKGATFINFLTDGRLGKCVIFIDEFEKIYQDSDDQRDLLSVMDGQYDTNLIFLMTVNGAVTNPYLNNRLNRIKYKKNYGNLPQHIIDEVVDDILIDKTQRESIDIFFNTIGISSFDLLINIIKEMNLFKESAVECGKHLNLSAEEKFYKIYEVRGDKQYPCGTQVFVPGESLRINRQDIKYLPAKERQMNTLDLEAKDSDSCEGDYYELINPHSKIKELNVNYSNWDNQYFKAKFILFPTNTYNSIF